jgi:hypothetical protein
VQHCVSTVDDSEPLVLLTLSGSFGQANFADSMQLPDVYTFTAQSDNETVTGTIGNYEADEACYLSLVNVSRFSEKQKAFIKGVAAGSASMGVSYSAMTILCALAGPSAPLCIAVPAELTLLKLAIAALSGWLLKNDPIDSDFTHIAMPLVPTVPLLTITPGISQNSLNAVNALMANEAQIVALEEAILTAFNRASGAEAAGDTFWDGQQLQAAKAFEAQLSAFFGNEALLLTNVQTALTANSLGSISIPRSTVLRYENSISFSLISTEPVAPNLPPDQVAGLQSLGLDGDEIAEATRLAFAPNATAAAVTLPDAFGSAAWTSPFADAASAFGTPSSNFSVQLETSSVGFELSGTLTLGAASNGINPPNESVSLEVGHASILIPPGSFKRNMMGTFSYEGYINGISIEMQITPKSNNTYALQTEVGGAVSIGNRHPIAVGITIGDDFAAGVLK